MAIGAQADGRFDALIHTGFVAMTAHNNMPEPFVLPARSAYAAGSIKLDVEVATLDMLANTFMRAPGEAVGTFALESAIDELANLMKMDPIELRIRNEPDKDPTGAPSSRPTVRARSASAGAGEAPRLAHITKANGGSASAVPLQPIRTTACRAGRRASS